MTILQNELQNSVGVTKNDPKYWYYRNKFLFDHFTMQNNHRYTFKTKHDGIFFKINYITMGGGITLDIVAHFWSKCRHLTHRFPIYRVTPLCFAIHCEELPSCFVLNVYVWLLCIIKWSKTEVI